ncbi:MXAN_6640 family putative metalloprotease [Candidatus Zixiibacteriota bacterium]
MEILRSVKRKSSLKPLRKPFVCILLLSLSLICLGLQRHGSAAAELSAMDAILQAQRQGELDEENALVYRIWSALDPERLPPRFSAYPRKFVKSLTPLLLEIRASWDRLSPRAREQLAPYLLRPTEPGQEPFAFGHSYEVPAAFFDSPGGHFRIWYVTSTSDSPELVYSHGDSIPDWIHLCAQVFDQVWETEIDLMGYRSPPADGSWYGDEDYGGDSRYDVYVENLDRHYVYGYTQSEFFVPSVAPHAATSYIVVDNDYSSGIYPTRDESGLMVTAAHELFHAVHFAYDALEDRYFMEITATWMEDMVYDDINDYYNYLSSSRNRSIFGDPELSLTTFDGFHEYSSCVWAHYLSERFGSRIIREIWQGCIEGNSLGATEVALGLRISDLASAVNEFAVWNYFTNLRADTINFYDEGDNYPAVRVYPDNQHANYPVQVESVSHPPEPLGASYIQLLPQETPGGLRIKLNGEPGVLWKATLVGDGSQNEVIQVPIDGFGHGEAQLLNWSTYSSVALVVTPVALSGSAVQFDYQAVPDSTLTQPQELATSLGQNYPNPVTEGRTVIPVTIGRGVRSSLNIFTVDGQLVRQFDWGYLPAGQYYGPDLETGEWDCTNAEGKRVSAGVYLYQLQAGDVVETRKMVVVR